MKLGAWSWSFGNGHETIVAVTDGSGYGYKPGKFTDPLFVYWSENENAALTIVYARNREMLGFTAVETGGRIVECSLLHPATKQSGKALEKL